MRKLDGMTVKKSVTYKWNETKTNGEGPFLKSEISYA